MVFGRWTIGERGECDTKVGQGSRTLNIFYFKLKNYFFPDLFFPEVLVRRQSNRGRCSNTFVVDLLITFRSIVGGWRDGVDGDAKITDADAWIEHRANPHGSTRGTHPEGGGEIK